MHFLWGVIDLRLQRVRLHHRIRLVRQGVHASHGCGLSIGCGSVADCLWHYTRAHRLGGRRKPIKASECAVVGICLLISIVKTPTTTIAT